MKTTHWLIALISLSAVTGWSLCLMGQTGPNSAPKAESEAAVKQRLMKAKLAAAHEVVSALSTEDFDQLKAAGKQWMAISESSAWQVRRDPIFMHYNAEFQRTAQRLVKMAEKENIEGATFAYINATVNCMACHRHVRGVIQIAPQGLPHSQSSSRRFQ